MIIAFANKKLEVTTEEKEYLFSLRDTFGEDVFIELFKTDNNGLITAITPSPSKPMQIIILFFIMNIMLNQRLRLIDNSKITSLEKRIEELEKKLEGKNE